VKHVVRFTVLAESDLTALHDFIAADSLRHADTFIAEMQEAIESLANVPRRCPKALEHAAAPHRDLRQLIVGEYRVIFEVAGHAVTILHVRHAARRPNRKALKPHD